MGQLKKETYAIDFSYFEDSNPKFHFVGHPVNINKVIVDLVNLLLT